MSFIFAVKICQHFTRILAAAIGLGMAGIGVDLNAQIIPASRVTDWTPQAAVGVVGGIPNRTVIGANVKSYGAVGDGIHDDSTNIVNALAACPDGQVLYFPAGNYKLLSRINATRNNVTWRGAGMGKTVLLTYAGDPIYCGNGDWNGGPNDTPTINITSGAIKGSVNLTVNSLAGLAVGKLVTLTQINPPWVHANTNYYAAGPNDDGHNATRLMAITMRVIAIAGNIITIEHPLPTDFTNAPMLTPWNYLVQGDGWEDMTFDLANGGGMAAVQLIQAYNCWFKGVEIKNAGSRQLFLVDAVNCEIRDCYTHDARGGGANHEGIDFYENCCFNLIENNVCMRAGFPAIILGDWGGGCAVNVVGYNYISDIISGSSVAGWAISDNHGPHNMFNLIEGNVAQNICSDGYYGSSSHGTIFRNNFSGYYTNYEWPSAIHLGHWSDYYNIVGNVLGQSGFTATYQETNNGYASSESVLYRLGYPNAGNTSYAKQTLNASYHNDYDLTVQQTVLRTGNFDYANNAVVWDAAGAQTIPASMYYLSQPNWWTRWGNTAWPPIGSDLTTNVGVLPAQLLYLAILAGTNTPATANLSSSEIPLPPSFLVAQPLVAQSPVAPSLGGGTNQPYVLVSGTPADWIGTSSKLSQSLKPSATVAINTIKAQLQNVTSTSAHFEIRTAANGGGTLLGSSAAIAPAASTWNTFVFAAPVTVASGATVYLTYVSNSTDLWFLARDSTATGQAYNGSSLADGGGYDYLIEVDVTP